MSIRWCVICARTAGDGLALPMSSPRYTCAESTLTISTGAERASASAQSLLPTPVGPASSSTGSGATGETAPATSAAAQEQLIELLQREACPGGAAVIA